MAYGSLCLQPASISSAGMESSLATRLLMNEHDSIPVGSPGMTACHWLFTQST